MARWVRRAAREAHSTSPFEARLSLQRTTARRVVRPTLPVMAPGPAGQACTNDKDVDPQVSAGLTTNCNLQMGTIGAGCPTVRGRVVRDRLRSRVASLPSWGVGHRSSTRRAVRGIGDARRDWRRCRVVHRASVQHGARRDRPIARRRPSRSRRDDHDLGRGRRLRILGPRCARFGLFATGGGRRQR